MRPTGSRQSSRGTFKTVQLMRDDGHSDKATVTAMTAAGRGRQDSDGNEEERSQQLI